MNDHDYLHYSVLDKRGKTSVPMESSSHTNTVNHGTTTPTCTSQTTQTSTITNPIKGIRVNKSRRLQESLKTNERFRDLNEKKFADDKCYQERKNQLIKADMQNKENYRERKASALESIANSFAQIASQMSKN